MCRLPAVGAVTHGLIEGLIVELPEPGSDWPLANRDLWLNAAKAIFDLLYEDPPDDEDEPIDAPLAMDANGAGPDEGVIPASSPSRAPTAPIAVRPDAPASLPAEQDGEGQLTAATSPAAHKNGVATCPECGKHAVSEQGLAVHRARAHGIRGAHSTRSAPSQQRRGASRPLIGKAGVPAAPVIRHGVERFLCSSCPRDFPTREALVGHLQKGHPPVAATTNRPFGEAATIDFPRGGGSE